MTIQHAVLPEQVLVQNGELLTGTLCKRTLGASGGSLAHVQGFLWGLRVCLSSDKAACGAA